MSELTGKKIVIIANLVPATIRNIKSNGMLLAADDGKTVSVLTLDKAPPGTDVGFEFYETPPAGKVDIKAFKEIKMKVKANRIYYNDSILFAGSEEVTVSDVTDGASIR